ncbi:hypothetical protein BKA63DRAFT_63871 [Paraphoma chrysanthemicola]|nr:hypothetical protein BKA63DRAFT_63871 [Paraphoma chrysanthemicola]
MASDESSRSDATANSKADKQAQHEIKKIKRKEKEQEEKRAKEEKKAEKKSTKKEEEEQKKREKIREKEEKAEKERKAKNEKKDDDIVVDIVKSTAATVGFVSEIIHHQKDKKQAKKQMEALRSSTQAIEISRHDNLSDPTKSESKTSSKHQLQTDPQQTPPNLSKRTDDLTSAFLTQSWTPVPTAPYQSLSLPIIIPQRRPMTRSRGFVRAYPPLLASYSIPETIFLSFIDTLNTVLAPNEWYNLLNLADVPGLFIPEPALMLVGVAAGLAAEVGMEAQSRVQGARFLERVNKEFWTKRGLWCGIVGWKGDGNGKGEGAGLDVEIGRGHEDADGGVDMKGVMKSSVKKMKWDEEQGKRLQAQMQKRLVASSGEFACLEAAPLVFPSSEEVKIVVGDVNVGKKKGAMSRAGLWLDEYMDKHAQEKWREERADHPTAGMLPKAEFKSRYSDRNHAARSGDLGALFSGGDWRLTRDKSKSSGNREDVNEDLIPGQTDESKKTSRPEETNDNENDSKSKDKKKNKEDGMSRTVARLLEKDHLYLVITSLSSMDDVCTCEVEWPDIKRS